MNQKRQIDYQWLVNTLLTCSSQKVEILQDNLSLLDAGLVRTILEVAEKQERWGDKNSAHWLKNLATQLITGMGKSLATITMEAEADQLVWQAEEHHKISEYKYALELWQRAVNTYQRTRNYLGEGSALVGLGICHDFLGEYQKAIDYYQQALEITHNIEGIAGKAGKGICLGNIGKSFSSLGEYQKAIEYHKQSLEIAQEVSNRDAAVTALGNLGCAYYSLGRYKQALEHHQEQLNLAQEVGNRIEEVNALGSLGLVLYFIGQNEQARDCYQKAWTIAREIGARAQEASLLSNLAACYNNFLGNNDKAVDCFQQALEIQREIGDRFGEASSQSGLGMTYRSLGQHTKAIECYQVALVIVLEIGDRSGQANYLSNLGLIYNLLGQYRHAIESCKRALIITQEIGDRRGEGFALNNLGIALLNSGQLTQSENTLCAAMEIKESLRIGLEDTHKVSIFETQADTYSLLQQVLVLQHRPNEALEIAERGRTRAFVDLLYQHLTNIPKGITNEISQAKTIESPTLNQIQQIVQAQKTTIIEYSIINSNHLFIWVIDPTGKITFCPVYLKPLKQYDSSLADLVANARKFSSAEKNPDDSTSAINDEVLSPIEPTYPALQQLYEYLIQPIFHLLPTHPNTPIIFIPHGSLFLVPFPALQDKTGKFLLEHYKVLTAPSIQLLNLISKQREGVKNQEWRVKENLLDALVVGNPTMPIIPLTDPPVQLQDLTWAQAEAEAIAPLLNTVAITGKFATKVTIRERMLNARLIHLATHGLLDDIRQLGIPGAIALAPSKDDNGFLTTGEILEMQLNAELVVLSACSTGQGKITGDGVIGLSRSLIAAGVPSVIVSLWSVNDQSTAFLMIRFYQNFQQGMMPVTALNDAQRWLMGITKSEMSVWLNANQTVLRPTLLMNLRRKLNPLSDHERPFRDPFHWAAFCAIGQ